MRKLMSDQHEKTGVAPLAADAVQPGAVQSATAPDPARRGFLKAAPLGALAVVAGTPAAAAPVPPEPAPDPAHKRGYHETDHIRRYYQTAAYW